MATDDAPRMKIRVREHECGEAQGYNALYDAFFCAACNVWVSPPCGAADHDECIFDCAGRPEKPSEVP